MKRVFSVIMVCLLCLSMFSISATQVKAETGNWTTRALLPEPKDAFGTAVANNRIYVIGGSPGLYDENYEYDPVTNSWTAKARMPTKRYDLATVAVGNKIYALGGTTSNSGGTLTANEQYDPTTNSWQSKASMPTSRNWLSATAVNNKIYAIAGTDQWGGRYSINEMYDPVTDKWTTKTPCNQARFGSAIAVANGKIYLIGGWTYSGPTNSNEEYDPQTDTWTTKKPMPTARVYLAAAALNGRIYAIGGATDSNPSTNFLNVVEEYDPSTDTWRTIQSMPTQRNCLGTATIGDSIYAIGGWGNTGDLNVNEEFTAGAPVAYWKFDEDSSTIAHDSSGNGNDGTIYAATWVDGKVGKALWFNGIGSYVSVPDSSSLDISGNQMSVEFWVKFDRTVDSSTPYMKFYDKGDAYNSAIGGSGKIRFTFWIAGDSSANLDSSRTSWLAGTWYHIAEAYDGNVMSIYVNGALDNSMPMTGNIASTTYPVALGAYTLGGAYFLQGTMDEFKIYNYARTAQDILSDYNSVPQGPVGYWKFDEGSGSVAHDSAGTNDGVIRGVPSWTTGIVGGALRFDGAQNNYVALSSQLGVTDAMTVEAWVYPEFDPTNPAAYPPGCCGRQIIRKSSCGDDTFFLAFYSGYYFNPANPVPYISAAFFYQGGGGAGLEPVSIPGLISEGQWYYLVATFKRNDYARLYVNGVEKMAVPTEDKPLRVSSRRLTIGQEADIVGGDPLDTPSDPQTWIGKIDEAKIYDYARTAEKILSDYQSVGARTLRFSGYDWIVKSSDTPEGPGKNIFSNSNDNVWVDESGQLHLKITQQNGKWFCAEIYTTESLGYGKYVFYLSSRIDLLDKNVVLGLFTYDDTAPEHNYREIDVEFSKWGQQNIDNSQYVVQPSDKSGNKKRFDIEYLGDTTSHSFAWTSDRVFFQSLYGHHSSPPDSSYIINQWAYFGADNPVPGNERVHINLWLYDTDGDRLGDRPWNGQEVEVIINGFQKLPVPARFNPSIDGYSFPNLIPKQTVNIKEAYEALKSATWSSSIPSDYWGLFAVLSVIVHQFQLGNCFGMSYTAKYYYEHPSDFTTEYPSYANMYAVDMTTASPEILTNQFPGQETIPPYAFNFALTYLNLKSLNDEVNWMIKQIDNYKTVQLYLVKPLRNPLFFHSVLAYDYRPTTNGLTLYIYDPNANGMTCYIQLSRDQDGNYALEKTGNAADLVTVYDLTGIGCGEHGNVDWSKISSNIESLIGFVWNSMSSSGKQFLGVRIDSPANVLITDPNGFMIGCNNEKQSDVNEIEGAFYSGNGTEPQIVIIPDPVSGTYSITLVGTATGNYNLILEYVNATQITKQSFNGAISTEQTIYYSETISSAGQITPISWEYVFKDTRRGTMLKISTDDKYFQFTAPGKDFGIRHDPKMIVLKNLIMIGYSDSGMCLAAVASNKLDLCIAMAWDKQTRKEYWLVGKRS